MGRIVTSVTIESFFGSKKSMRCDALVDTGASHMTLPTAWRDRLGELETIETVELETADQSTIRGEICGPVRIEVEGFRPVSARCYLSTWSLKMVCMNRSSDISHSNPAKQPWTCSATGLSASNIWT